MKKMGLKAFFLSTLILLTVTGVMALPSYLAPPINHGTLGVADTSLVDNILQITTGTPETPAAKDWIPCWGVNPWSYDGQWVVYHSQIGSGSSSRKNEICIVKADGTGFQRLTNNDVCDTHGNFTPDGTKIIFQRDVVTDKADDHAEIWIMNRDGSNQHSLTQAHDGPVIPGGCEQKALVSPDGTKIAFRACTGSSSDDESGQLWVMNIDGTNPVKVSGALTKNTKHSWSPDSQWILFSSEIPYVHNTSSRIYKVRANGANLTMLSANVDAVFCENWAAWSPDGQWISYHRRENDSDDFSQLWIMKTDGTEKQVLVSAVPDGEVDDEWVCGPHSWHPASKRIVFKKSLDHSPLFIINVDSKAISQLTDGYDDGRMWWGPDGKKILFKEYTSSGTTSRASRDGGLYSSDLLVLNLAQPEFEFDVNAFLASLGLLSDFIGNDDDNDDNSSGKTVTTSSSNRNCFIATAAFGSPLAGQVEILRQFRDRYLLTNAPGKKFVSWYYNNGPVAANWIKDKPLAKVAVQTALYPLIGFSFLLIGGYLPFAAVGLLLSTLLFLRFRPKKIIDI